MNAVIARPPHVAPHYAGIGFSGLPGRIKVE
jgi:hypothetical protein